MMPNIPVSMRLNPPAAAYVIQGVMQEAGLPANSFSAQIQQTVNLLYRWGGMVAVQAGSLLEQRLVAAAQQAQQMQAAQPQQAQAIQPQPVAVVQPVPVMRPAPVQPAPQVVTPTVITDQSEISVVGSPVIDVQPLG